MDIKAYLLSLPVAEREAFSLGVGTTYGHLRNVAYRQKPCAPALAINIERATGGKVRCEDLRPDVDWGYLRGTPAKTETNQEVA